MVAEVGELDAMEAVEAAEEKDTTIRQRPQRRIRREEAGSRRVVAEASID